LPRTLEGAFVKAAGDVGRYSQAGIAESIVDMSEDAVAFHDAQKLPPVDVTSRALSHLHRSALRRRPDAAGGRELKLRRQCGMPRHQPTRNKGAT
jgi:hypothetical protein